MDVQVFWKVIGNYNKQTWLLQIVLLMFILLAVALSYMQKVKWAAKFSLGLANLFIGIVFFCMVWNRADSKVFCLAIVSALRWIICI